MNNIRNYKCLNQQVFESDGYKLVPIRHEDRFKIMQWRNEQMYHLRQNEPLTKEKQDTYFQNIISRLFEADKPDQILFSFFDQDECIGYGGLVHIDWINKNAEISFIMETALEQDYFISIWTIFLKLLEKVAFEDLALHKLFVYAFDLRPHLYNVLEQNDYYLDARLKDHCFLNNEFKDVVIHSKINPE
jgi:RimJ/RimL family protein N-acetyltransferase